MRTGEVVTLYRATHRGYELGRPRGVVVEAGTFRRGPQTYNGEHSRIFHVNGEPTGEAYGWRLTPRAAVLAFLRYHSREVARLDAQLNDSRAACAAADAWMTANDSEAGR